MLQTGEFALSEFLQSIGVTERQWTGRKNEVLDNLSDCCEYYIESRFRGKKYIVITEVYSDYVPIGRKKNETNKEQKLKDYSMFALEQIVIIPLNSVANIARCAAVDPALDEAYHLMPKSIEKYIRPFVRSDKVKIIEKCWVILKDDRYIPLTAEQEEFLKQMFNQEGKECGKDVLDAIADWKSGLLSQEEAQKIVFSKGENKYKVIMQAFKERYGYMPIKVPHLELNAFNLTEEEKAKVTEILQNMEI